MTVTATFVAVSLMLGVTALAAWLERRQELARREKLIKRMESLARWSEFPTQ